MGLAAGARYSYRIRAVDNAGNLSPYSNVASATTRFTALGAIAAYAFNAGTGTAIVDSSGNGLTGSRRRADWTNSGKYGKALSFNGKSSYVRLGDPIPLRLTGSMTLSAWVYATGNPSGDGQIIAKSGDYDGWQLKTALNMGVRTFAVMISNGTTVIQRYGRSQVSLNTWHHVAGVYNAAARTLDIFVNGVLDNSILVGTVPLQQNNSDSNVNIGKRDGGYWFQGIIDEVQVYNRALRESEIQTLKNTPLVVQ